MIYLLKWKKKPFFSTLNPRKYYMYYTTLHFCIWYVCTYTHKDNYEKVGHGVYVWYGIFVMIDKVCQIRYNSLFKMSVVFTYIWWYTHV